MLAVTTENVPGYRVRDVEGQVFGIVVRSRGLEGNIMAGLRSLAGACWERNGERFEDPATGHTMEVLYDRASGERRYVRTGESASRE